MTRPRKKIPAQAGFEPGTFRSRGGHLTTRPTRWYLCERHSKPKKEMCIYMRPITEGRLYNLIITIALKGANRDFYNLLTAPRTVSNTYAQVVRAQSCANNGMWTNNGNWQTKQLDTWKATQLNLLRQESVNLKLSWTLPQVCYCPSGRFRYCLTFGLGRPNVYNFSV